MQLKALLVLYWLSLTVYCNNDGYCLADVQRDEKIKAELLAYEKSKPTFNQPPQDESSNSDEDNEDGINHLLSWFQFIFMTTSDSVRTAANQQVDDDNSSESESESDADHFTMTVGQKMYLFCHHVSMLLLSSMEKYMH